MKNWEAERRRRELDRTNKSNSDARAEEYSSLWPVWTPEAAARQFNDDLGPAVFAHRTESDDRAKTIYRNLQTGWTIVVDVHNRYFTVHCPVTIAAGHTIEMYVSKEGTTHPTGNAAGFHFRIPGQAEAS